MFKSTSIESKTQLHYSEMILTSVSSEIAKASLQVDWLGIADSSDPPLGTSIESELEPKDSEFPTFPHSETQLKSITCDAPAVLLKSGPGTGKTYALASRIAHLITTKSCGPEHMVVLSFTNRDARNLKECAIGMMFADDSKHLEASVLTKTQVNDRLWSGTIHAFASSLVNAYGSSRRKLRIISHTETRMRVDKCLHSLLDVTKYKDNADKLNSIRRIHRDALSDLRQSRGMVMHQISRCMELWKEAGILPPPSVQGIHIERKVDARYKEVQFDNCIEVAMRLGISTKVAQLAWEVYPEYQAMHETHGTADPSDVASLAYHILLCSPKKLSAIRAKLKHVILDEYQDVSVAQHALIRLVIRGVVDEDERDPSSPMAAEFAAPPVLASRNSVPLRTKPEVSFAVPKLFCCGDPNQSIYGWRGAAPSISVDGFRKDYPQGIVVPLETSFRLACDMWSTVNLLADSDNFSSDTIVQAKSPVGVRRQKGFLPSSVALTVAETLPMIMAADPSDEVMATVNIQGVWDSREEAKYIVTRIRKRSKSRVKRVIEALKSAMGVSKAGETVIDPSEIAIITRSANHLSVIKEALESGGIPYVVYDSEAEGRKPRPVYPSGGTIQPNLMNPVALMTMHRAKGEEFDEVYLPGWSEGEFPHPTAVSSNRVDEERRLAYVAISRARSHVMITHSFVRRDLNQGPNLGVKNVTAQVKPSRFLYELVPDAQKYAKEVVTNSNYFKKNERNQNVPSVVWNRGRGTKEMVAGGNLPAYFANTFKTPKNFENPHQVASSASRIESQANVTLSAPIPGTKQHVADPVAEKNLSEVIFGLNQLAQRVRGSKTKYKQKFRANLNDWFGFTRGTVPTFTDEWMLEDSRVTPDRLREITAKQASGKNAASQCSATQLGLYLVSMLL